MNTATPVQTSVPVQVLFGFDASLAAELEGKWKQGEEAITIFYGGSASEASALKKWWREDIEGPEGWPRKILVIGGSHEDPTFAVDFVSTMAAIRPNTTFDLQILCRQCGGFGDRTSQKLKLRKFVSRVESLKNPNLKLDSQAKKVAG